MANQYPQSFLFRSLYKLFHRKPKANPKNKKRFGLEKRQKFAIGVAGLTLGLFLSEFSFSGYGVIIAFFLALLSEVVLWWGIQIDLEENFSAEVFILPFLYSLSFGLFSFLTPARILIRLTLAILYAVGLYSVFLSENIFAVASVRTIALLSSARIVSLLITLITYFFLTNTIFSLRLLLLPTVLMIGVCTLALTIHAIWTYTLVKSLKQDIFWIGTITLSICELVSLLWFWPTTPTVVALFLASTFYTLVGISHVWLDKRLFRNVIWEYMWVGVITMLVLIAFTQWQG